MPANRSYCEVAERTVTIGFQWADSAAHDGRAPIGWANVTETGSETRTRARFEVPEELRADVRLLGEILGKVLVEYAGQPLLDDVEKLRELTIAGDGAAAEQLVASWPHERAEDVARAFTCYFHLTNLSEELHRARVLRARDRSGRRAGRLRAGPGGRADRHRQRRAAGPRTARTGWSSARC